MSSINLNKSSARVEPFQAVPRQEQRGPVKKSIISKLAYPVKAACACIAYYFGVGSSSERHIVIEATRDRLKDLGGREFTFRAEDGVQLEGMHIRNPNALPKARTILICSGSHESYERYTLSIADAYLKMGHNVVLFNYRGFGKSRGSPSEAGFNKDAEAAYQHMRNVIGLADDQIVVHGYSMGSEPATDLAAHHPIDLVLDRYIASMKDAAGEAFSSRPIRSVAKSVFKLGGAEFDIQEKIKSVQGKIFLAHETGEGAMSASHQAKLRLSLGNNPDANFFEVDTDHDNLNFHDRLWFHPDHRRNEVARQNLQLFLYRE